MNFQITNSLNSPVLSIYVCNPKDVQRVNTALQVNVALRVNTAGRRSDGYRRHTVLRCFMTAHEAASLNNDGATKHLSLNIMPAEVVKTRTFVQSTIQFNHNFWITCLFWTWRGCEKGGGGSRRMQWTGRCRCGEGRRGCYLPQRIRNILVGFKREVGDCSEDIALL